MSGLRVRGAASGDAVIIREDHEISDRSSSEDKSAAVTTAVDVGVAQATAKNLRTFRQFHAYDANLPIEELLAVEEALQVGDAEKEIAVERALFEENSPYPEVRASVRNYDEDFPCNTIRAWTIGLLLTTVGSGINMLFSLRQPSISISTFVIQLVAYPLGLGWDLVMPDREFNTFGLRWNLKPGKFNTKEHTIIIVMANAAYGGGAAYSFDTLVAQTVWYGQDFGWWFSILYTVTTQMIGYGLAGVSRRWLVWPAAMIWPGNLVNTALLYALHDHSPSDPATTNGWKISRYHLFLYVCLGSFVWYWFPGWIFQALSVFGWITWIAPNNVVVNQIFGPNTGLGLLSFTFDWSVIIGYLGDPMIPPWFATANTLIGLFIFTILTAIGVHYTGAWYSDFLPMSTLGSYDNTGLSYNVSRILDENLIFSPEKYSEYSPLFLSTTFALAYGISFATVTSVIVHTYLYHGTEIVERWKMSRDQEDDIHMRLMKKYRDAPDWWYIALFVSMVVLSFITILVWDTTFVWWSLIVCLIIPLVWMIPIGMVLAMTNIGIGLNVITEFIVGYMTPGRPLAMMMFKTYGYMTMAQGLSFVGDLKLGHYMKIPPRTMFASQTVATLWSSIVQVAVMKWAMANIADVCTPDQPSNYTCPGGRVFFTASIIWGAIGPSRMFSPGAIYSGLMWFFLIGAILPILTWLAARRWPKSPARYLMIPVMFGGLGAIPPAGAYNYLCWGFVGFVFQYYVRRKFFGWFKEYNYITAAALDTGLILSTIVIFFTLQVTLQQAPNWWGNVGFQNTLDAQGAAIKSTVADGEYFGPLTWQ